MTENILELNQVMKSYDKKVAVNQVSFNVPKGSIFGLLGPNGAGKTSLIRIITTITRADSGTVQFDGEPLNSNHPSQIGYMPEERGLYKKMEVGNHLMYLAQLKGMSKSEAKSELERWFEKFEIQDWWKKKVQELSKGMQQKVQFISTVLHKPKLLILDEPFSGLDPINTNLIKSEIRQMKEDGVSIIFSTHRMEQVEEICELIVLINDGKNILEGEVSAVKNQYKQNLFQIDFSGNLPPGIDFGGKLVESHEGHIVIQLGPNESPNNLLQKFIQAGVHIQSYNEILPSLNEIFIKQVEQSY